MRWWAHQGFVKICRSNKRLNQKTEGPCRKSVQPYFEYFELCTRRLPIWRHQGKPRPRRQALTRRNFMTRPRTGKLSTIACNGSHTSGSSDDQFVLLSPWWSGPARTKDQASGSIRTTSGRKMLLGVGKQLSPPAQSQQSQMSEISQASTSSCH